jgi:dephospho-CoA kinase
MKNKIAIFVCGSGGSGKSTFVKTHFVEYIHIDVDIIYEELLLLNKLGLKIKDFNESQSQLAAELFEKAKELNNERLKRVINIGNNLIIDGIGRDSDVILNQRKYLENFGYDTFMIMLYADLDTCISRVEARGRVYKQKITEDSWYLSYNNIGTYKKEFGIKFKFIYNDVIDTNVVLNEFLYPKKITKKIL